MEWKQHPCAHFTPHILTPAVQKVLLAAEKEGKEGKPGQLGYVWEGVFSCCVQPFLSVADRYKMYQVI